MAPLTHHVAVTSRNLAEGIFDGPVHFRGERAKRRGLFLERECLTDLRTLDDLEDPPAAPKVKERDRHQTDHGDPDEAPQQPGAFA